MYNLLKLQSSTSKMKGIISLILRAMLLVLMVYYWSTSIIGCLAFEIVKFSSSAKDDTLKLLCIADTRYDWCSFNHIGKTCKIEWKKLSKGSWKSNQECTGFDQRVKISAPTFGSCALELQNLTSKGKMIFNKKISSFYTFTFLCFI